MNVGKLGEDEVHLWWASCSAAVKKSRPLYDLLDVTERTRADRFRVGSARLRYLAARALSRLILARYTGAEPATLGFASGSRGKPRLEHPGAGPPVCFNAAHSGDTVVVAVARFELGVDVERIREVRNLERLAARYCSDAERDLLGALSPGRREAAFLRLWTGKEAYLKAIGSGVAMPLRWIEVELAPLRLVRINNDPHPASEWTLLETVLPEPATCALAIRAREPRLHVREFDWPV